MKTQEAYKIVFEDMMRGCMPATFKGCFDAVNGSEEFMYGIETVMSYITSLAGAETYQEFRRCWDKNFQKSLDKARKL